MIVNLGEIVNSTRYLATTVTTAAVCHTFVYHLIAYLYRFHLDNEFCVISLFKSVTQNWAADAYLLAGFCETMLPFNS